MIRIIWCQKKKTILKIAFLINYKYIWKKHGIFISDNYFGVKIYNNTSFSRENNYNVLFCGKFDV